MATTRDHVAAYDYESRRRVTSLMLGADEAGRDPRRRLNRTLVGSLLIAVLAMAGFGIAGLLGGGRRELPESGAVRVTGTGERYVVVDGVVHPALNLSSALLVGAGTLTDVRASALDGKPRGLPIGIPDAPDSLPGRLARGPWTVCATSPGGQAGQATIEVLVGLPAPTKGGLGADAGVVVDGADGSWLVTLGRRYRLTGRTREVLGSEGSLAVPTAVLNTLPEGPEIAIPTVTRGGVPTVPLPVDAHIGDVIKTELPGQPTRFFVVERDGIAAVTPLTAALLAVGGSGPPISANPAILTSVPTSAQPPPGRAGWPKQAPRLVDPARDQPLCVSTSPGSPPGDAPWSAALSVPPELPAPAGIRPVVSRDAAGSARLVAITPGTGALVLATTSAGQDGGYNLVTDSGQRFPVSSGEAVDRLRLDRAAASRLPWPFVALLPSGPTLDPDLAAKEYPGEPPS